MTAGADRLLYRLAGVPLVRATTHPDGMPLVEGPNLTGASETVVNRGLAWLKQEWQREEVRRAVGVASPVLSQRIHEALDGIAPNERQVRRLVHSLVSYLLRWQGRATPFGLFAGVTTAQVGGEVVVRWRERHRAVARVDAQWLGTAVSLLELHPDLLGCLPVVANGTAFVRGHRLVAPGQPPDDRPGALAPIEISVRHTPPVRMAMDAAREPIRFGELAKLLAADYPTAPLERISSLLTELVAQHFLLTSLRAPMTVPDALGHLLAQLEAADAEELPDLRDLVHELRLIHGELLRHNEAAEPASAQAIRETAVNRMHAISEIASQPLVVDTALDCEVSIPKAVIREAEVAASALLRLTPYPFGYPRWKDFHVRFRQGYGVGAVVPVPELVADTGLGLPAGYLGSQVGNTARTLTERDETLLALVQQTIIDGAEEIVLTEPVIRALAVGDPAEMLPPPRAELAFQIHAASPGAVQDGAFRLLVTATPRPGSSMAGRFADLLPEADRKHLSDAYASLSTDDPEAIAAQLSFSPRRRRSENVVRTPHLLPQMISLSEHRDPHRDHIGLHDLAVTADARQLYLVQLSTGRGIEPRVLHALEAGALTPPLARFLAEITTARCAVYKAFDWGAAVRLPYLPRLRYGRTVLSPARWLLTASDLPSHTAPLAAWDAAFEAWRSRLRAPASVVLCETDLRLPLDLERPLHRALLRARLARAHEVELQEAPAPDSLTWFGRAHELLVQMRLARPRPAEQQLETSLPLRPVERDAGHLPGRSLWLYAQIYGHPDHQDEILTEHLPGLLDRWADLPLWWFRRHRDTTRPDSEQYLGLYLRLPTPAHYGEAATRVGDWGAGLRGRGLVPRLQLATYHPEDGRYGHSEAMAAAEAVFGADSAAALAEITLAVRSGLPTEAVTAAGLVDLAASYASTPAEGHHWLISHLPYERGPLGQKLRDTALRLADAHGQGAALRGALGGETVTRAWERRRTVLAEYRTQVARQRDPDSVLRSLLHMHHVRTIGVGPDPRTRHPPPGPCRSPAPDCPRTKGGAVSMPIRTTAAAAEEIARQLTVPEPLTGDHDWRAQSLSKGAAGIALLHIERAHTGEADWRTAHRWVEAATADGISAADSASLLFGVPALAFVLHAAEADGTDRYGPARTEMDTYVTAVAHRRIDLAQARIDRGEPPAFAEYDLLHGLTGIGAHLLQHTPDDDALGRLPSYLVRLTEPLRVDGEPMPGWWVSHDPYVKRSTEFPAGTPTSASRTASPVRSRSSPRPCAMASAVDRQSEAIHTICTELDTWRQDSGAGPWWPQWINRNQLGTGRPGLPSVATELVLRHPWHRARPTACRRRDQRYGTPTDCGTRPCPLRVRPQQLGQITDTSLCHGWAGLYQTVWRAAQDALTPEIGLLLPQLTDLLVQHGCAGRGEGSGLLEGEAGLALALHTAAHPAPPISEWDACLLIN